MGPRAGRTPVSIPKPDPRGAASPFPLVSRWSECSLDASSGPWVFGRLVARDGGGLRRWGSLALLFDDLRPDAAAPASPALLGLCYDLPLGIQAVLGLEGPDAIQVVRETLPPPREGWAIQPRYARWAQWRC